jgi:Ca-activated chloride channel homolog
LKIRIAILSFSLLVISQYANAQKPEPEIYKGNEFYRKQQYDKASEAYQQALTKDPKNGVANFNSGNATFRQNKFDEALNAFDNTINNSSEP